MQHVNHSRTALKKKFFFNMPQKKKNSKAAKKRLNNQGYNSDTGQFNDKKDTYIPLSEYSEDSSDEEFINERIQQLGDFTLIRSNDSNNKRKKLTLEIQQQQNIENMVLSKSLLKLLNYHNQLLIFLTL